MTRVLILDGHCAAALAFARSLGRAGHWVAVGAGAGSFAPAAQSRYCNLRFEYPSSIHDEKSFCAAVLTFVEQRRIDLVIPMTDWTTLPISRSRHLFASHCELALPPHEALRSASDKYQIVEMARRLSIPTPETWLLHSVQDLEHLPTLDYPVVVKDRESARWLENRATLGSVRYAYSESALRKVVQERLRAAGDVLIQKFVTGTGIGFSCFVANGQAFLPFQWERVREIDPRGSGSSCRRSVAIQADVMEFSRRLLLELKFEGAAMVEYKIDRNSGELNLMEVNARPWGSIQLAIASGFDYPEHMLQWYLRRELPPKDLSYRTGIVCRRMVAELDHLNNLRRGRPPGWPAAYPNFWTTLLKIAVPWYPGMSYEDLSFSDPLPGAASLVRFFRRRSKASETKPKVC